MKNLQSTRINKKTLSRKADLSFYKESVLARLKEKYAAKTK